MPCLGSSRRWLAYTQAEPASDVGPVSIHSLLLRCDGLHRLLTALISSADVKNTEVACQEVLSVQAPAAVPGWYLSMYPPLAEALPPTWASANPAGTENFTPS